jgi:hypothetical protein
MNNVELLKQKVRKCFESQPKQQGFCDVYPSGPLKMCDDSVNRCFVIFDSNNEKFIQLTIPEIKILPDEIKKYFSLKGSEREKTAIKDYLKIINITIKQAYKQKENVLATLIVESLREWCFSLN